MKRTILMMLMPVLMLLPAIALEGSVYACGASTAAQQVGQGIDETNSGSCDDSGVKTAISTAVQILSLVAGAAAVIAIISSGLKYITSGGDSSKIANAKNTLIYALIGIAIAVMAQLLVRLVITQANTASNPCPTDPTIAVTSTSCKPKKP